MHSRSRADLGDRLLGLLPTAATAAAEGAWIAVVYAAVQLALARGPLAVGVWAFAVAAWAGIVVGRRVRGRAAAPVLAATVAVAVAAGWLADPAARDLVAAGVWGSALTHHGAGWLAGLAVWRGARHADPTNDDLVVGSLLGWGVPGLAAPWLVGTAAESSQAFVDSALPATLLFVAAGLVAIGLTRLDALGRSAGVDWRRNRTWFALLVGVVGLVIAVGTPIAFLLGASVEAIARTILGPVRMIVGAVGAVVDPVGAAIGRFVGPFLVPGPAAPLDSTPPGEPAPSISSWLGTIVALAIGLALVAGALRLRRVVRGGPRPAEWHPPAAEDRRIALPALGLRLPSMRLPRFRLAGRRRPRTATEAYLALMRELASDELLARASAESPARHARRLRTVGAGSLALDLLAADFELERYGGATLAPAEVRRAIRRSHVGRSVRRGLHGTRELVTRD